MEITTWGDALDYTFRTRHSWRHGSGSKAARINANHFTRLRGLSQPVDQINNALMSVVGIELEDEGKSDATINRIVSAVSCCLNHCAFDELIPAPSKFRRRKEGEGRSLYFTKDEVAQLCAGAVDPFQRYDLRDVINFAAYTGLRRGEILKLKAQDVDLTEGLIHVGGRPDVKTKANNYRAVPIHTHLFEMLARRTDSVGQSVAIFGDEWEDGFQLLRVFQKVQRYVDIDLNKVFHCLRHSFGTWHAAAGTDIRTIMYLMGHKRLETTLRYAKVGDKMLKLAMTNI